MPFLSIIIPVYNCEKYLSTAVMSALNQGISACEIIIVDDGSTDHSSSICLEFCRKYANIKLLSQENRGASAARNAGIAHASGEYIAFLDADDILLPDCFGGDILSVLEQKHDVVMFSSYGANVKRNRYRIDQRYSNRVIPGGHLFSVSGHFGACLYRRELLVDHNIYFAEGVRLNEDQVFKLKALYKAKTIRTFASFSYVHNATPGSIMQTIDKAFDRVDAWREAYRWFELHCEEQQKKQILNYVNTKIQARMLLYAKSYIQSGHSRKQLLVELERVDGLQMLMSINGNQVMPYQVEELKLFQTDIRKFIFNARLEGWKISMGRLLLRIPMIRSVRDRKQYPLTQADIELR